MAPEPHRRLGLAISSLFNLSPSSLGRQRDLSKVMPDCVSSLLVIPPTLSHFSLSVPPRVLLCKSSPMPASSGSPLYPLLLQHSRVYTQTHACTHTYIPTHTHGLLSNQTKPCLFMPPKLLLSLGLGSSYCLCLEYSLSLLQRAGFYQISA